MLDGNAGVRTATSVALQIYDWAKEHGALAGSPVNSLNGPNLLEFLGVRSEAKQVAAVQRLRKLKVVTVGADDAVGHIAVMLKNQLPTSTAANLPSHLHGFTVEFIGHSDLPRFPMPVVPQSTTAGGSRFWNLGGRFACGSSVAAAPSSSVGTMGALVRLPDGALYGLTNNHVTGDCNHTEVGMHVLCPAAPDAEVGKPPPTAIGTHAQMTLLGSGDPSQQRKQRLDAAIFRIIDEALVSSLQGDRFYDTPTSVVSPTAHMRLKKVGRTSGLTKGRVTAPVKSPVVLPYSTAKFTADVHFENLWSVVGLPGEDFSTGGDSGSLVVTEDGASAVGLVLGGSDHGTTYIMPIADILAAFGATLVGGHNL